MELKPYNKASFTGTEKLIDIMGKAPKQCIKTLTYKNISIYKVRTDVLGRKHFIKKEGDEPKLNFNTKSEKNI